MYVARPKFAPGLVRRWVSVRGARPYLYYASWAEISCDRWASSSQTWNFARAAINRMEDRPKVARDGDAKKWSLSRPPRKQPRRPRLLHRNRFKRLPPQQRSWIWRRLRHRPRSPRPKMQILVLLRLRPSPPPPHQPSHRPRPRPSRPTLRPRKKQNSKDPTESAKAIPLQLS